MNNINEKCIDLGIKFILNFKKIYENPEDKNISNLVNEMNNWYNIINNMKSETTGDSLLIIDKINLFFCAGTEPINILNNNIIVSYYDKFICYLVSGMTVYEAINKILVEIKK